jgi:hypothetical protein
MVSGNCTLESFTNFHCGWRRNVRDAKTRFSAIGSVQVAVWLEQYRASFAFFEPWNIKTITLDIQL